MWTQCSLQPQPQYHSITEAATGRRKEWRKEDGEENEKKQTEITWCRTKLFLGMIPYFKAFVLPESHVAFAKMYTNSCVDSTKILCARVYYVRANYKNRVQAYCQMHTNVQNHERRWWQPNKEQTSEHMSYAFSLMRQKNMYVSIIELNSFECDENLRREKKNTKNELDDSVTWTKTKIFFGSTANIFEMHVCALCTVRHIVRCSWMWLLSFHIWNTNH